MSLGGVGASSKELIIIVLQTLAWVLPFKSLDVSHTGKKLSVMQ